MTTVNIKSPVNLFISTPKIGTDSPDKTQINLFPEQRVRAQVIEAGLERTVVEINQQRFLAQGGKGLRVGQEIQLQVLQTQPRLEFKVLTNNLKEQLSQSLPLLTRPFDWSQLIGQLQQQLEQGGVGQATSQIYRQLQQILNPLTAAPLDLEENIATIVSQLKQLMVPTEGLSPSGPAPPMLQHPPQVFATFKLSQAVTQLVKNLQNQMALLPNQSGQKLPENWYVATRSLLAPLRPGHELSHVSSFQRLPLITILRQIQQHPAISPQLKGEVKRI